MKISRTLTLTFYGSLVAAQEGSATSTDPASYKKNDIIIKDVAVIGGGATGTYASINLKDRGVPVTVIEKTNRMGGHEATYIDPTSGTPIDFGVQAYWNIPVVQDFFKRFNIPTTAFSFAEAAPAWYDFTTGRQLVNFTFTPSLAGYAQELLKYPELAYSWNLKYPVSKDLLLPFGQFIQKYSLQNETWLMWNILAGVSNPGSILEQPTVNIFKWLDVSFLDAVQGGDVTTKKPEHNNGELYAKAQAELLDQNSLLLSSIVIAANRNCAGYGVCLAVQTPNGVKLVLAKKLLITAPPTLSNMSPFGLSKNEQNLFQKWIYSGYYAGLVRNTGLTWPITYHNADPDTVFNYPKLPDAYFLQPTNLKDTWMYWYAGPTLKTRSQVESHVLADIRRLTRSTQKPEFVDFADHSPFKLVVSANDIAGGFYKDLLGLQGAKNTWYTGAAWMAHGTGPLWNFTHYLLPDIQNSL